MPAGIQGTAVSGLRALLQRDTGRTLCRDTWHAPSRVPPALALPPPHPCSPAAAAPQVSWQRPRLLLSQSGDCFTQEASDVSLPQSAALHAQLRATRR